MPSDSMPRNLCTQGAIDQEGLQGEDHEKDHRRDACAELGDDVHGRRPATASMSERVEIVGMTRVTRKPARSSSESNCRSVRSRPPTKIIMSRSRVFAKCGVFPGGTTLSSRSRVRPLRHVATDVGQDRGQPDRRRSRGSPGASHRDRRRRGLCRRTTRPRSDSGAGPPPRTGAPRLPRRARRVPAEHPWPTGEASSIECQQLSVPAADVDDRRERGEVVQRLSRSASPAPTERVMASLKVAANSGSSSRSLPHRLAEGSPRRRACRSRPWRRGVPRDAGTAGRRASR